MKEKLLASLRTLIATISPKSPAKIKNIYVLRKTLTV